MRKRNRSAFGFTVPAFAALLSVVVLGANEPPDLTKGETKGVDRTLTYNLGPTGLRGWISTKPATFLDSVQGRTTAASRQILITHVGVNSPASGVMEVDDVILGAGGSLFRDDARKSMGTAIQEAETAANGGILKLTRFRAGKNEEVQLKLRVMGSYRETAPYDCPKSARILDEACKALAKEPLHDDTGPIGSRCARWQDSEPALEHTRCNASPSSSPSCCPLFPPPPSTRAGGTRERS